MNHEQLAIYICIADANEHTHTHTPHVHQILLAHLFVVEPIQKRKMESASRIRMHMIQASRDDVAIFFL